MQPEYQIPERFNEKLNGNLVEIKRLINQIPEYREMNPDPIYRPLIMANSLEPADKTSYFSYEQQVEFLKRYEDSNRRVAEEFLGRKDGILFAESIEKLPQWEINYNTIYEDIILFFTEVALAQQQKMNTQQQKIDIQQQKIAMQQQRINNLERELHNPIIHIKTIMKKLLNKISKKCKNIFR